MIDFESFSHESVIMIHEGLLHSYSAFYFDDQVVGWIWIFYSANSMVSFGCHRMSPSNYKEKDTVARFGPPFIVAMFFWRSPGWGFQDLTNIILGSQKLFDECSSMDLAFGVLEDILISWEVKEVLGACQRLSKTCCDAQDPHEYLLRCFELHWHHSVFRLGQAALKVEGDG